jgi:hypothetical protein
MQTTVPFGSSLDLVVSSKCSLISLPPRTRRCGERGPKLFQQQLRCGSNFQKPFFVGDCSLNSLINPKSGLPLPRRPPSDPQTRALARFFVNGRKWGQKEPQNSQNPPKGGNGAVMEQSWVQSKGQGLLQKSAWVAAIVLLGGGALYGQGKARGYLERTFLPPVATMIGQQFGREVQLGRVQRLTPFSVTLGPCSVGAHDEEFSVAEIPGLQLKILPLASLRRGQVVLDAVVAEPHILLSQKEDWTWLGLPMVGSEDDKILNRHSSEPNLDARTKVRRLAREEDGRKGGIARRKAARDAAKRGYTLPGERIKNDEGSKLKNFEKQMKRLETELEDSDNEEGIDTTSSYLGVGEADGIKAGKHVEERLTEDNEGYTGFELRNSVLGAKVWIDTNMLRPVKRKVVRRWTKQGLHAISKTVLQRKNLDRSAAAARKYFQKVDGGHPSASGGGGASGSVGSNDVGGPGTQSNDLIIGSSAPVYIQKMEVLASGDNGGGYGPSPFSPMNRTTFPPMSLSSSWSARENRKDGGKGRQVFPNLKLQIENAIHYKRGIGQVNFRKVNGMRSSLKSLGVRALGRNRRDYINKEADHTSTDLSKVEEKPSQVTIDSVREALVQAIRDRQENYSRVDRKELRPSNEQSGSASNLPQEGNVVGHLISNEECLQSRAEIRKGAAGHENLNVEKIAEGSSSMSKAMDGQQILNMTEQATQPGLSDQQEAAHTYQPVALNSVYFRDGTLMLLAYGDREPR